MKTNQSKRYIALNNIYVSIVPTCEKALLLKDSIVRLHKHVKSKYVLRCYHCSQLYQDYLVNEDQFERCFKNIEAAETMLDLQHEFRNNIEVTNCL